jgi:hypothetical protein
MATKNIRQPIRIDQLKMRSDALDDNRLEDDPEKPCKLRARVSGWFPSWNLAYGPR